MNYFDQSFLDLGATLISLVIRNEGSFKSAANPQFSLLKDCCLKADLLFDKPRCVDWWWVWADSETPALELTTLFSISSDSALVNETQLAIWGIWGVTSFFEFFILACPTSWKCFETVLIFGLANPGSGSQIDSLLASASMPVKCLALLSFLGDWYSQVTMRVT